MKLQAQTFGPCGVYILRVVYSIILNENKIKIGFDIVELKNDNKILWKEFSLGDGGWELDKFLREIELSRKDTDITRGDIIGKEVWGAVRVNKSITEEGTALSREIFAFHIISERNIRPTYIDEPERGEEPKKESNFYQVLDFTNTVEFQEDVREDSEAPQIPS